MRMDVLNTDDKGSLDQLFEKIGLCLISAREGFMFGHRPFV